MKLIDLSGQTFGNWKVLEKVEGPHKSYKCAVWKVECQCGSGKVKFVGTRQLRKGISKGCGCNRTRLRPFEALYRRLVRDNSGGLRTIPIDLTYEEFVEFTKQTNCFYCGADLHWQEFTSSGHGYNLDRKDNNQGYVKDNLVVCCQRCNAGKMDTFTFDEWYAMTAVLRNRTMDQELSLKEVLELQRQTLELLRQTIQLLQSVVTPPVFRTFDTIPAPAPFYSQPWTPVTPGSGTVPNWPNGTIICNNESRASMEAMGANRGERV